MVARYLSRSPALASAYPPVQRPPRGTRRSARRFSAASILAETTSCTSTPPHTNRMSQLPACSSATVGDSCSPLLAGVGCPSRLVIAHSYTGCPVRMFAIRSGSTAFESAIIEYRGRVRNAYLERGRVTCRILRLSCLIATPALEPGRGGREGGPDARDAHGGCAWGMRMRDAHEL